MDVRGRVNFLALDETLRGGVLAELDTRGQVPWVVGTAGVAQALLSTQSVLSVTERHTLRLLVRHRLGTIEGGRDQEGRGQKEDAGLKGNEKYTPPVCM